MKILQYFINCCGQFITVSLVYLTVRAFVNHTETFSKIYDPRLFTIQFIESKKNYSQNQF